MKLSKYLLMSASLLGSFCSAHAGTPLTVGSHLSPAELSAMGGTSRYTVGGTPVTVVPAESGGLTTKSSDGSAVTTVVNANGVVGLSRNEVLVAQIPTATVRSQAASLLSAAKSVSYYEHMQITSVRYASFAQAAAGREKLQTALPQAKVTLPIEYQQRKPR